MPTPKKTTSARKTKSTVAARPIQAAPPNVCHSCNALPAGSAELMGLMLVLVFSLTAVLFTSVYAMQIQDAKMAALEAQITYLQAE